MSRHCEHCGTGRQCYSTTTTVHSVECPYCLAAEVEALRARNETLIATIQRQDSTFERQMEEHEELEALRAQVQAVRALCQSARVSISKGCLCYGDECSGTCGRGKPMGWNLNPDDILRALDGDA